MPAESAPTIRFDPVGDEHVAMLRRWLAMPHVRRWWGDPDTELELIRTGRSSGEADGYIVHVGNDPVGYIQSWVPSMFNCEPWIKCEPWIGRLPVGSVGVDIFIGERAKTGRGLGPAIIRAFCDRLRADGVRRIIIDPDVRNAHAIAAYRKAGFAPIKDVGVETGETLLLELTSASQSEARDGA